MKLKSLIRLSSYCLVPLGSGPPMAEVRTVTSSIKLHASLATRTASVMVPNVKIRPDLGGCVENQRLGRAVDGGKVEDDEHGDVVGRSSLQGGDDVSITGRNGHVADVFQRRRRGRRLVGMAQPAHGLVTQQVEYHDHDEPEPAAAAAAAAVDSGWRSDFKSCQSHSLAVVQRATCRTPFRLSARRLQRQPGRKVPDLPTSVDKKASSSSSSSSSSTTSTTTTTYPFFKNIAKTRTTNRAVYARQHLQLL